MATPSGPSETTVREQLDEVIDPCSAANGTDLSLVDMGLVDTIGIDGAEVTVSIQLTTPGCTMAPYFVDEIDDRVGGLPGVNAVSVEFDDGFTWRPSMMTDEAREKRRQQLLSRDSEMNDELDIDLEERLDETLPRSNS